MLDIHIQPYFILQTLMRETCRHESQNQADATDREELSWKLYIGLFITWFLINSVINEEL